MNSMVGECVEFLSGDEMIQKSPLKKLIFI